MLDEGTEPRGKYQQGGGREDTGGECWEQRAGCADSTPGPAAGSQGFTEGQESST